MSDGPITPEQARAAQRFLSRMGEEQRKSIWVKRSVLRWALAVHFAMGFVLGICLGVAVGWWWLA